jgi:predicted RNase H-like nuclease (RuvC/YqgF family)
MNIIEDDSLESPTPTSPRLKIKMLQQMAEALEDEATGLYRRAALFEEEDHLLNREIDDRQTEINRFQLKLDALRSERDGLLKKIEEIKREASMIREEAFESEEEAALASITRMHERPSAVTGGWPAPAREPGFFRRRTLSDVLS